jgi:hypothetical protein
MRKNLISLHVKSILACALCTILTTFSCQKKNEATPSVEQVSHGKSVSQQEVAAAKQALAQSGQANKLVQKWTTFDWSPQWNDAFRNADELYIPLRFTQAGRSEHQEILGTKKFLVVVAGSGMTKFRVVRYVFDKMEQAQYFNDTPDFLLSFTGICVKSDLATGVSDFQKYVSGRKVKATATVKKDNATGKTSALVCTLYYECWWQGECNRDGAAGQPYTNYTITLGEGSCKTPTREACEQVWGKSWIQTNSVVSERCVDTDDPQTGTTNILLDGVYSIEPSSPTYGFSPFELANGSSVAGGPIVATQSYIDAPYQQWLMQYSYINNDERVYSIRSVYSQNAMTDSGTRGLTQEAFTGAGRQQWTIEKNTDNGRYYIINTYTRRSIGECILTPR